MSENKMRISFQEHFHDLTIKTQEIIRSPINTENMQPFHMNAMSKIKQMLDMKKVNFTATELKTEESVPSPKPIEKIQVMPIKPSKKS